MDNTTPQWLQILGNLVPYAISIGTLLFVYLRDRADIKQKAAQTDEIPQESDRQDSKMSLDWALQFKDRMEKMEKENRDLRCELTNTQKQMTDLIILNTNQNARIIKLEGDISVLTEENTSLKVRVKELEDENKKLRGDIKC
ncbi:hypothetical protein IH575_00285 [Candidatus Dojkabacteria bacterium]|nr:hypothetical protein [Candidatus Dojkabacteria bacterium]